MATQAIRIEKEVLTVAAVGLFGWLIPGGGYFVLGDKKRGTVVLVTLVLTFLVGLYIGSIGVIDPVGSKPWYVAQVMNSPAVILIGNVVAHGYQAYAQTKDASQAYFVFGRACEIGQIYTSIAGLLNLLCIVNAVYIAHTRAIEGSKET